MTVNRRKIWVLMEWNWFSFFYTGSVSSVSIGAKVLHWRCFLGGVWNCGVVSNRSGSMENSIALVFFASHHFIFAHCYEIILITMLWFLVGIIDADCCFVAIDQVKILKYISNNFEQFLTSNWLLYPDLWLKFLRFVGEIDRVCAGLDSRQKGGRFKSSIRLFDLDGSSQGSRSPERSRKGENMNCWNSTNEFRENSRNIIGLGSAYCSTTSFTRKWKIQMSRQCWYASIFAILERYFTFWLLLQI